MVALTDHRLDLFHPKMKGLLDLDDLLLFPAGIGDLVWDQKIAFEQLMIDFEVYRASLDDFAVACSEKKGSADFYKRIRRLLLLSRF